MLRAASHLEGLEAPRRRQSAIRTATPAVRRPERPGWSHWHGGVGKRGGVSGRGEARCMRASVRNREADAARQCEAMRGAQEVHRDDGLPRLPRGSGGDGRPRDDSRHAMPPLPHVPLPTAQLSRASGAAAVGAVQRARGDVAAAAAAAAALGRAVDLRPRVHGRADESQSELRAAPQQQKRGRHAHGRVDDAQYDAGLLSLRFLSVRRFRMARGPWRVASGAACGHLGPIVSGHPDHRVLVVFEPLQSVEHRANRRIELVEARVEVLRWYYPRAERANEGSAHFGRVTWGLERDRQRGGRRSERSGHRAGRRRG